MYFLASRDTQSYGHLEPTRKQDIRPDSRPPSGPALYDDDTDLIYYCDLDNPCVELKQRYQMRTRAAILTQGYFKSLNLWRSKMKLRKHLGGAHTCQMQLCSIVPFVPTPAIKISDINDNGSALAIAISIQFPICRNLSMPRCRF